MAVTLVGGPVTVPSVEDEYVEGVRLTRTEENLAEIDALAALLGGRAGVETVLADLNRQGRRALPWGRAVRRAFTWDREDRATPRWYPQGITTSADADDSERVAGRQVVVVAWYYQDEHGNNQGSRVTFVDLETLRYRHVLLVSPRLRKGKVTLAPLKVHAGGIVWRGPYLHVAATTKGFMTCRLDDLMRIPDERGGRDLERLGIDGDEVASYGYRYVLPARFAYQAYTDEGHERMKYSFLSLDRAGGPAGDRGRRVRPGHAGQPAGALPARPGVRPAAQRAGRGLPARRPRVRRRAGHAGRLGGPGAVPRDGVARSVEARLDVRRRARTPASAPVGDAHGSRGHRLLALDRPALVGSEHPRRRWVFAMPRAFFD